MSSGFVFEREKTTYQLLPRLSHSTIEIDGDKLESFRKLMDNLEGSKYITSFTAAGL